MTEKTKTIELDDFQKIDKRFNELEDRVLTLETNSKWIMKILTEIKTIMYLVLGGVVLAILKDLFIGGS